MTNSDFSDNQEIILKEFLKISKIAINNKRIGSAYLLYLLSKIPDDNKQNIYTKTNKVLLRDTLKKRRRLYLDYLVKNDD